MTESPADGQAKQFPDGAGPDHIDFAALESDDATVLSTPRDYWDAYEIRYTEPPDRRRIEGDYYINASTGEVISELWHGARDYRNGPTYAYVQPASQLPGGDTREEWDSDPQFSYHNATDAYYRYDRKYGQIPPTNIGRHTDRLAHYSWEAAERTTHHGVRVIEYQLSDPDPDDANVPAALAGSLKLGAEDGIVYAFELTLDAEGEPRYTYVVRPAPFPDHEWVETAQTVTNTTKSATETG